MQSSKMSRKSWAVQTCVCGHLRRQHDSEVGYVPRTGKLGMGKCQVYYCGCPEFVRKPEQKGRP